MAHGQKIEFKATAAGGLLPDNTAAIEIDGKPHTDPDMLCYRCQSDSVDGNVELRWVYTIGKAGWNQQVAAKLVGSVIKYFDPPDRSADKLIFENSKMAVYRPNNPTNTSKGKPAKFSLLGPNGGQYINGKGSKAGLYIGDRFVETGAGRDTYFGYHIKQLTTPLKKLINRDQKLVMALSTKGVPREMLIELWRSSEAQERLLPCLPERSRPMELAWLQIEVPKIKALPKKFKRDIPVSTPVHKPSQKPAAPRASTNAATAGSGPVSASRGQVDTVAQQCASQALQSSCGSTSRSVIWRGT